MKIRSNNKHKASKFVIIALIILALTFILKSIKEIYTNSQIIGPIGMFSKEIRQRNYEQGKMLRISFVENTTDIQAQDLIREWSTLQHVNGSSFYSSDISGEPIADIIIDDLANKEEIMQILISNPQVKIVVDKI